MTIPLDIILAAFMFLFMLLTIIATFFYYVKVVRKIDKIILTHGIDRDQFDQGYLRFNYYKKAVFNPDFFTERRKMYIFDPKIIVGKITITDKKIMKAHTYINRVTFILIGLAAIANWTT